MKSVYRGMSSYLAGNAFQQENKLLISTANGSLIGNKYGTMADNPCFDHGDEPHITAHTSKELRPSEETSVHREQKNPLSRIAQLITVEPIVTAYYITFSLTGLGVQNMLLYKTCWPDHEPGSSNITCPIEEDAQRIVADFNSWRPFVMQALPILCLAFAGSWCDHHGGRRKPLILLPLVGSIAINMSLLINAFFWEWPPIMTALADCLPYGLSGGQGVLNIGVMGYIADITTHQSRTMRLGVVMAFVFLGTPIGLALGGVLSETIGLVGLFATCGAINSLALLYGVLYVRETGVKKQSPSPPSLPSPPVSGTAAANAGATAAAAAASANASNKICDLSTIRQAVRVLAKPRSGFKRSSLIMLLCANPFVVGPLLGEGSVLFLFVRVKFGWTPFEYGIYACFKMTVILIGTLVSMAVFCHWLQIEDSKIGMIACSFQIVAYIMYSCVNVGWAMYVVPLLEFMLGAAMTVHKSIVSKLVPNSEMGQVTAILSINEAIVPLIVNPMYNKLYQHTLSTTPGAFYYLGASLSFPGAIIFCMVYMLNRSTLESRKKDDEATTDTMKQSTVAPSSNTPKSQDC